MYCYVNPLTELFDRYRPVHGYEWFQVRANRIVDSYCRSDDPGVTVSKLSKDDVSEVERARPGYGDRARAYINGGHVGFAVWEDGQIAAMAWLYHNQTEGVERVKYFPLEPGHAWFHADWTKPEYRGRGHHKRLIYHRAKHLNSSYQRSVAETNIRRDNEQSIHNYTKLGFEKAGILYRFRMSSNHQYGWKRRK